MAVDKGQTKPMKRGGTSSGCASTAATPHTDGNRRDLASASMSDVSELEEEMVSRKAAISSGEAREDGPSDEEELLESPDARLPIARGIAAGGSTTEG